MTILLSLGGILIALGTVVFFHEFGHFIVAKKSGIKVEQFSFGFGKEIFGFQWGETRYTVNWIPLGGFVRMAGEFSEGYTGPVLEGKKEEGAAADHSRDFMAQPWYHRVFVALAGPFMNYVLAVAVFFGVLLIFGQRIQSNPTEIGETLAGMPAEKAGFKSGDVVRRINGEPVDDFLSIAAVISKRPGQPTNLTIERRGREIQLQVTPVLNEEEKRGLIGILPADPVFDRKSVTPGQAIKQSVFQCWFISASTVYYLVHKIVSLEKPGEVAGPIGIFQMTSKAVQSGVENFAMFIGFISVAIGLFNLFPIPLLDGGHVLYYVLEGVRGKPLSPRVMGRANAVGMAVLLTILAFATFNDIKRLRKQPDKPPPVQNQK